MAVELCLWSSSIWGWQETRGEGIGGDQIEPSKPWPWDPLPPVSFCMLSYRHSQLFPCWGHMPITWIFRKQFLLEARMPVYQSCMISSFFSFSLELIVPFSAVLASWRQLCLFLISLLQLSGYEGSYSLVPVHFLWTANTIKIWWIQDNPFIPRIISLMMSCILFLSNQKAH